MSAMGKEILMLKARLADKKQQLEDMKLRADSYIILLRDIVDPYTEDFTTMDIDRALVTMRDFKLLFDKAKDLKAQIADMEKDLNG